MLLPLDTQHHLQVFFSLFERLDKRTAAKVLGGSEEHITMILDSEGEDDDRALFDLIQLQQRSRYRPEIAHAHLANRCMRLLVESEEEK